MTARFNVLLVGLLVLCALGLVTSQNRARNLFVDVERAQTRAAAHEVRWNQLQVEQTEYAKAALVDARARRELGMQSVAIDRTLHLSIDPVTRAVSLSQPWIEKPGASARGVRAAARAATPHAAARAAAPRSVAISPQQTGSKAGSKAATGIAPVRAELRR